MYLNSFQLLILQDEFYNKYIVDNILSESCTCYSQQMDLTGDSSMMSNADSTLDTSNLRKALDKTNWWKNIDESMLNIPTADLTA
jgi:hypothetical protein